MNPIYKHIIIYYSNDTLDTFSQYFKAFRNFEPIKKSLFIIHCTVAYIIKTYRYIIQQNYG